MEFCSYAKYIMNSEITYKGSLKLKRLIFMQHKMHSLICYEKDGIYKNYRNKEAYYGFEFIYIYIATKYTYIILILIKFILKLKALFSIDIDLFLSKFKMTDNEIKCAKLIFK